MFGGRDVSGRWVISLAAIVGGAIIMAIHLGLAEADSHSGWQLGVVVGAVIGALGGVVFAILLAVIQWLPSLWREHRRIVLAAGGGAVIAAVLATTLVVWDRTPPTPRPSSLEAVVINLDFRRDALGRTYELSIRRNGDVTYVGHRNVPVRGRQTARISQAEVARLVEAFYESEFFTMRRSTCGSSPIPGCISRLGPITYTTISFDGFTRKVYAQGRVDQLARAGHRGIVNLYRLQDMIAAVAVANGWLTRAR